VTRPTRIAIAVLSVVCGVLIVALVWVLKAGDGYEKLEMENARLRAQVVRVEVERDETLAAVQQAKEKAKAQDQAIAAQAAEVARLKKKLRKPPPEAEPWTVERDEVIAAQTLQIDTQALAIKTCWQAQDGCESALEHQIAISLLERERADNCMTFTRKQKRRERVKIAFTAIGGVAAGFGVGYGVAQFQ